MNIMMTKKDMKKVVSGWGSDPTRRMIMGLTIALDGAIAEANEDNPFDFVIDIQKLLESVWDCVYEKEMNKHLRIKYEKELAQVTDLGAGCFFFSDKKHRPNAVVFDNINGFDRDNFPLDPTSDASLRKSLKTAADTWTREYMEFENDRKK